MTSPRAIDDLNALLEERAQYERWIAQLNAKREQTPPHVFERVRTDYATRLETVMSQLRSRGEGLEASANSLQERVATVVAEETLRRDVRAEIELRSMVGEYDAERANAELAACNADIGRLEAERAAAEAELNRVQEILSLVKPPVKHAAAPAPVSAPASRPLGAPGPGTEPDSTVDELAFLNSLVEPTAPPPVAAPAPAPPPAAPPAAAPAPAAPAPAAAPRVVTGDIPLVTSLEAAAKPEPAEVTSSPTLRQTAGTPAFLKGMPTEQVKTLKCQECGTMNYPTEWYCERCGGELAAM